MRKNLFNKAVSVFILAMFVMSLNVATVKAASSAIKVKHEPMAYFVSEKRIKVETGITEGVSDVKLVRCYFRAIEQADYVFIEMTPVKKGRYVHKGMYDGILPVPGKDTQTIQYLFLVVDQKNQPIKTQVFTVKKDSSKETPAWQMLSLEGAIQVSTELADAPKSVPGFSDSITMNVAESSARFGVVAGGIYSMEGSAAAGTAASTVSTGTTTGAVSTGTAVTGTSTGAAGTGTAASLAVNTGTAASGATAAATLGSGAAAGLSTAAMIGIGAGAAAVIGGGALALGGSSGDGDAAVSGNGTGTGNTNTGENNNGNGTTQPATPDVISSWEFHSKCISSASDSPVILNFQVNETKGGAIIPNPVSSSGQRSDYEGGILITTSLDAAFDAKIRTLSGSVTTTTNNLPFSCTRRDNIRSISIPSGSGDTGYQTADEQGSTGCGTESGCVLQVRFIKR